MNLKCMRVLLAAVVLMLLATQSAFADNVYASIKGVVTDSTGAVVPGATVTATNTQTGASKTATSQQSGAYEFLQLAPGPYSVSATKDGFKTFKTSGFTLNVNQVFELPVSLQVGTVSETVEVKADAVQVETTFSQSQTLINGQQIVDLPLIGRNFTQLEQLAPGVMSGSDRFGAGAGGTNFSINGAQTQQSSFLVNGTDSNDVSLNTAGILPSPDAIQEFNLISSSMNAEFSRNSGGIVNALIKNGTNQFHGNAFDFYRDTFLNTRNYFAATTPTFHQNLFGGTFGGPIFKDKTFFFLSYQGTRNRATVNTAGLAAPQTDTVFTQAERNGDFSADLGLGTNAMNTLHLTPVAMHGDDGVLYPAGTRYACGGNKGLNPCGAFSTIFHQGTPTFGHLNPADFNSVAVGLMNQFVPLPNLGSSQFTFNPNNTNKAHQGIARVDHNLTQADQLWGVIIINDAQGTQALPFTGANLPGFDSVSSARTSEYTAAWNHTFSTSMLNELRLGYFRFNFQSVIPAQVHQPSEFGFTNITPQNQAGAGAPVIALTGFFTLGFSNNGPQPRNDQNYQLTDNFSKVVGKHSMKFGFDGRRFSVDNPFFFLNDGSFTFNTTGGRSSKNSAIDFLMGAPDAYAQGSGAIINARAYEYYGYAQDTWKAKSNLTLNFGAGYQIDTPYDNNQYGGKAFNCFIPGEQSTVFPSVTPGLGAPVGLTFPGDPGCTKSGTTTKYGHIGPRFGFAWSPNLGKVSGGSSSKFSIRGGYGIYFNRTEEETALQNLGAPPFGLASAGIGDIGGRVGFADPWSTPNGSASIPNKFPFTPPALGTPDFDFSFFQPLVINTNDPRLTTPYAQNFNLNIQREFPANTVVSVGYVGSLGRHLYRAYEANPITAAGQAACLADLTCRGTAQALQHLFFTDHSAVDGSVFGSVGMQHTDGTSNYNSLQVNLNKGMTHGLQLITSYTWSHAIDNGSGFENTGFGFRGLNVLDPSFNIGDSGNDARQRIVLGYIYAIPSLHSKFGWANDRIFGGWKMSGITTFQNGFPVNLADTSFTSLSCDAFAFYGCPDSPNQVVSSVHTLDPRSASFNGKNTYWFDPSNFAVAPLGSFGNTRRDSIHGPGINNTDLSLLKDTKINERMNFQMGIEGFNLFNHTQFTPTAGNFNIQSGNFGRITAAAPGRLVQLRAKFNF